MAFLAKAIAFGFGLGVAGVVLFLFAFEFAHAWMPLILAAFMSILVGNVGWTPKGAFSIAYQMTWIVGALELYVWSSGIRLPPDHVWAHRSLLVFSGLAVLASILLALQLPLSGRRVALWLVAVLLIGLGVAYFSGPPGQLGLIGEFFGKGSSAPLIIRKVGHFVLYGTLAYCAARASIEGGNRKANAVVFALAVVLAVAGFDELRQSTHPQRVGSPMDLLIDLSGAAVFLCFIKATKGVRSK